VLNTWVIAPPVVKIARSVGNNRGRLDMSLVALWKDAPVGKFMCKDFLEVQVETKFIVVAAQVPGSFYVSSD
jgi:hypothetical protein